MNVVIGIISRCNDIEIDEVLISKRPKGSLQGDLWEFPGGKCNMNESKKDCIIREIKEELNVDIEFNKIIYKIMYLVISFTVC